MSVLRLPFLFPSFRLRQKEVPSRRPCSRLFPRRKRLQRPAGHCRPVCSLGSLRELVAISAQPSGDAREESSVGLKGLPRLKEGSPANHKPRARSLPPVLEDSESEAELQQLPEREPCVLESVYEQYGASSSSGPLYFDIPDPAVLESEGSAQD